MAVSHGEHDGILDLPQEALTDDGYGGMMCTQEKQCKVSCTSESVLVPENQGNLGNPWDLMISDGYSMLIVHIYHYMNGESQASHLPCPSTFFSHHLMNTCR